MVTQRQTLPVSRLVQAVRSLLEQFRHELTGARQATRTQLIQFLAKQLEVPEENAATLFDQLRHAGVIVRGDEHLAKGVQIPGGNDQQWDIRSDSASDSEVQRIEAAEGDQTPPVTPPEDPPALDLLRRAIDARATDIHFDPFYDEIEVRFRIDGRLEHYCRLSDELGRQLIFQLKIMANLKVTDPFRPQEGRVQMPAALSDYRARITATPVTGGEAIALRLLRRDQIIRPLDTLGLASSEAAKIGGLLKLGEGLVLVTGPSGAGKTTMLYSLVHALDNGHRNIVTIEDPVEYDNPAFLQIEVDERHGITMASGLRTSLRMDPDVLLLGEIRDAETAVAAMRAASCGKYVFSTFHTRDAASVVTGLRDLDVDARSLSGNLRAIISQRLIRRLCQSCCQTRPIEPHEREMFRTEGIDAPEQLSIATGCQACRRTGYHERIGAFEIVVNTDQIAEAIDRGASEREIRDLLRTQGARGLVADGLDKVRQGITTLDEVRAMSWVTLPG